MRDKQQAEQTYQPPSSQHAPRIPRSSTAKAIESLPDPLAQCKFFHMGFYPFITLVNITG